MENIILRELINHTTDLYNLLFLADPSKVQIDLYLNKSKIYGAYNNNEEIVGVYVLYPVDTKVVEIKNIAVKEIYQKRGVGTILLEDAANRAKLDGFQKIIISTSNSSIYQLRLYKKQGFNIDHIIKDFFIDNYDNPIFENGMQAEDMIVLVKNLYWF